MGRTRTQQAGDSQGVEEIAAAIAALLGGLVVLSSATSLAAAVAAVLERLPERPQAPLARRVARLVVADLPVVQGASDTLRRAHIHNLILRAHYSINAVRRVARFAPDYVRAAFGKERRHYAAHREPERRRVAGARMVDAAVELHGPVLGWRHGHPKEPRPHHAAADGKNFDARRVPLSTGALPGVLPGCTCTVTAPFEGAQTLR